MNIIKEIKEGIIQLKLEGALTVYEVADLKDELMTGIGCHDGLIIDIDALTDCDTLGIQLLYSAGKTARGADKTFSLTSGSEACWEAAARIGLEPEEYLNPVEEE